MLTVARYEFFESYVQTVYIITWFYNFIVQIKKQTYIFLTYLNIPNSRSYLERMRICQRQKESRAMSGQIIVLY